MTGAKFLDLQEEDLGMCTWTCSIGQGREGNVDLQVLTCFEGVESNRTDGNQSQMAIDDHEGCRVASP